MSLSYKLSCWDRQNRSFCLILPSYDMFCLWVNWFSHFLHYKWEGECDWHHFIHRWMQHSIKRMHFQGPQIQRWSERLLSTKWWWGNGTHSHVRRFTTFADLSSLANTQAEKVFVTRVLEERNFWFAVQYMMEMSRRYLRLHS